MPKSADQEFIGLLETVLGPTKNGPISLHQPQIGQHEQDLVQACLGSGWVSSLGDFITRFEGQIAKFTGSKHVIALVNGTSSLHLGLRTVGVLPNDEVIVPTLSFVATANAVAHCGAIPNFVDSNNQTMGMDPDKLREYLTAITTRNKGGVFNANTGHRIGAIVPMHTFGHPTQIIELIRLGSEFGIPVVEDAAESLGSFVEINKTTIQHTGTFGHCGVLSFNGNKTVTTGGGGAILTNDESLAQRIRHLATTAKLAHQWEYFHDHAAWNYRMPNLNAALGCAQMDRIDEFIQKKQLLAKRYKEAALNARFFSFVDQPRGTRSNFWLNTIRLSVPDLQLRNELLSGAHKMGYLCRPSWNLLHTLPMYKDCPRADLTTAKQLTDSLINVPSSSHL